MDWRAYHAIYSLSLHHHWLGTLFHAIEAASIPFMVVATGVLWFLSRPGGDRRWKLATANGFAAAAVAYVVNFAIHSIWDRPRPYESHAIRHPWSSSTDGSFPSDHASLALAIAFAVLAFDSVAGAVLLAAAVLIAIGRVMIGAHYPGDVLASVLVAGVAAFVVVRLARGYVDVVVRLVERVSDPLVGSLYRRASNARSPS
ncbi:MAG TPA: phosphatase PAP2 family protein [Gaiellaceae bacterium]|nr:phosphatase PAP2 family protein [Gaiellaceae bacterium]